MLNRRLAQPQARPLSSHRANRMATRAQAAGADQVRRVGARISGEKGRSSAPRRFDALTLSPQPTTTAAPAARRRQDRCAVRMPRKHMSIAYGGGRLQGRRGARRRGRPV
jgi:hypothetical protein